jgi:hypothetical protein
LVKVHCTHVWNYHNEIPSDYQHMIMQQLERETEGGRDRNWLDESLCENKLGLGSMTLWWQSAVSTRQELL